MRAGRLRHRVTITQPGASDTLDAWGDRPASSSVTVWAGWEDIKTANRAGLSGVLAEATAQVIMRYRDVPLAAHVTHDGTVYDVVAVAHDPRRTRTTLTVKRR